MTYRAICELEVAWLPEIIDSAADQNGLNQLPVYEVFEQTIRAVFTTYRGNYPIGPIVGVHWTYCAVMITNRAGEIFIV